MFALVSQQIRDSEVKLSEETMNNSKNYREKGQAGFNLIELMIVIAIIALLISVSGYAWQVMIRRGNETAAISHITKINTAQAYFASKHKGKFAAEFAELVGQNLISDQFDDLTPTVDGYVFTLKTSEKGAFSYSISADPLVSSGINATGTTHYYLDSAGHTIRITEEDRPANRDDPAI